MAAAAADRNLLFGILALQMDFLSRYALIQGMNAWILEKSKPLGQVLVEKGSLSAELRDFVEAMIDKHLQMHGSDPQQSLAVLGSGTSIRRQLAQIHDPDLQASLAHVGTMRREPDDPFSTQVGSGSQPATPGLRFRILRAHARGGLGEVYVAEDEELHREVALKEIQEQHADDPESRACFMREAEITGGLEHPGIVPVYGLGQYLDGRPFYAMHFIQGDSLRPASSMKKRCSGARPSSGPTIPPPSTA